jgi:hypothetical protein
MFEIQTKKLLTVAETSRGVEGFSISDPMLSGLSQELNFITAVDF